MICKTVGKRRENFTILSLASVLAHDGVQLMIVQMRMEGLNAFAVEL